MNEYGIVLEENKPIDLEIDSNLFDLDFGESINPGPPSEGQNYNSLRNKPEINSVPLVGNISLQQLNLQAIYYDTKEKWNENPLLISEKGAVYIYSNYKKNDQDIFIPGIKIGDGLAYLIDLPFVTDSMSESILSITQILNTHTNNDSIHVSPEDRIFWDNKVTASLSEANPEELVLSKI